MSKWIAIYSVVDRENGDIIAENRETLVNVDIEFVEREYVKKYIREIASQKNMILFHNIYRQEK